MSKKTVFFFLSNYPLKFTHDLYKNYLIIINCRSNLLNILYFNEIIAYYNIIHRILIRIF